MPESIIKGYYENLRKGKLIGNKCKCGGYTFPPTAACEHCGNSETEAIELSGEGALLFVSHSMAPPPNPRFNKIAPYAYGHVCLEEGIYVQAIINGIDIEPESLMKYYEKCPVKVRADIIEAEGLPVLAFKIV
ncbi:Zn-ribbon domain-containing OB-fold protein [Geosporobacter ferrireducens]|uniref:ChsH2 rubredoxin-like zinc ribbon domain-containing protein n=1 Tax=Geosporobacter ferrireducens TaxID=1424294 RepID=A0A1D8GF89_9FIRM|nr:zinc ribbon domain-containing protein [Geosporobacter ferrireducens]AOT69568.1 hypothetical protein Gferi_08245 [Geosporobacter ferrireducens]MTI54737.1 hypothetical protein [Geosporobacter ferrireducens]